MAYCASCGSVIEGRYCPKCGAPAAGGAGPASAPAGGLTENVVCALCYLLGFITGILFLVLAPYNQSKTVRFHAFQSIFLHVALIALWILAGAVLPAAVLIVVSPLFGLAALALWLFIMWKSYQNQKLKLPLIGDLAEKQA